MRVLFLDTFGESNIRLTADGVVIGNAPPLPPPDFPFDTILVGHVGGYASFSALKTLGKWGVTVGLMGMGGTALSTFVPWKRNDAPLRLAQMRAALDPRLRLLIARAFLIAKVGHEPPSSEDTIPKLRRWESAKAQEYWQSLGIQRRSGFYKTLNAKATTPINASINYAQGVLSVRCRTVIAKVGLDESVGFLHESTTDGEAFVHDVHELLRQEMDAVGIAYANEIGAKGFVHDNEWVYRFKTPALARGLAERVCASLNRTVHYHGQRVSLDGVLIRELRRLSEWFRQPKGPLAFNINRR
jgi:CRISPR/Cas system-associated endonuclease Cas1